MWSHLFYNYSSSMFAAVVSRQMDPESGGREQLNGRPCGPESMSRMYMLLIFRTFSPLCTRKQFFIRDESGWAHNQIVVTGNYSLTKDQVRLESRGFRASSKHTTDPNAILRNLNKTYKEAEYLSYTCGRCMDGVARKSSEAGKKKSGMGSFPGELAIRSSPWAAIIVV